MKKVWGQKGPGICNFCNAVVIHITIESDKGMKGFTVCPQCLEGQGKVKLSE